MRGRSQRYPALLRELFTLLQPYLPWLAALSLGSLVLLIVAVPLVVLALPVDYFERREHSQLPWRGRHPLIYVPLRILKDLLALALVLLGVVLLFLPGQGLLTIAVGVLLLDFPGKYRLERWLVCRPRILAAFNHLRAKGGRAPFAFANGSAPRGRRPSGERDAQAGRRRCTPR